MKNPRVPALAALIFLLFLLVPSSSFSDSEIALGAEYGSATGTLALGRIAGSLEHFGNIFSGRVSGNGAVGLSLSDAASAFKANGVAELSAVFGAFVPILEMGGGFTWGTAFDAPDGALWSASGALSLGLNDFDVSASLKPRFSWLSGLEGNISAGAILGAAFAVGDFVLKPGAETIWTDWTSGDRSLEIRPGFGLSWYPGFPLCVTTEAGFRRLWSVTGESSDGIPAAISAFGAIGRVLVFSATAQGFYGITAEALLEASASLELSASLGRFANGEMRLPVALSWNMDPTLGFSIGAALTLSWD